MTLRARPPINESDRQSKSSHDYAKDGWSLSALERMLSDCEVQPRWRDIADLCCAYYDGEQLSPQQIYEAQRNGLEPRSMNLIARIINAVLGQEARSRRDPRLEPDDDDGAEVADVLSQKLKEAQREARVDIACSNGYASQVKAGLGWVEVQRCHDPRLYQYRVQDIHRNEMWWDWRAKQSDLSDARWICRRQWVDLDEITSRMPEFAEPLKNAADGWASWLMDDSGRDETWSRQNPWFEAERSFGRSRAEWIDGSRDRVRVYEVWYRVPAEQVCMMVGQRWVPVDQENPVHIAAIQRGLVQLEKRHTMQVRRAMFAGPHRLLDEGTTRIRFPYLPMFAFRRDADGAPYGLIKGMLPSQDEYNEIRMRTQWARKAQQLTLDADALDENYNTVDDIAATMMRPDMVAVLNPNRANRGQGLNFGNVFQMQPEQFTLMQDSKASMQDVAGIYSTQLGNAPAGVTSGLAINSLVEQGMQALGELNDNYADARRQVYDELVQLIAEDHAAQNLQVRVGSGGNRRTIVLNTVDEQTGMPKNVVKASAINTGLAEAPSSPAYQVQMSQMMADMVRALAGTQQAAILLPSWVEMTSAFGPARKMIADDMRRAAGLPTGGDRDAAQNWQAQQQQQNAQQAQMAQQAAALQMQQAQAKAARDMAGAKLAEAQAVKALVEADQAANDSNEQDLIDQALAEAMGTAA